MEKRHENKKRRAKRAYALSSVMALVFLLTVLLGVGVAHIEYSIGVMDVYLKRVQARSELISMTNSGLKWLDTAFGTGTRPRAPTFDRMGDMWVDMRENLTDCNLLSIFSSCSVKENLEGKVEIFDMDYRPENLAEPRGELSLFPPSLPGGYMIRAAIVQEGLAPLAMESVYVSIYQDVPETGEVRILRKGPVYWKESFR